MSARRDAVAFLLALALGVLAAGRAPAQEKDDIWGAGNEISNVQGGVQLNDPASVPVRVGSGPAMEALCDTHFRDMEQTDRATFLRIQNGPGTPKQKQDAYRNYLEERDRFSRSCAASFPTRFAGRAPSPRISPKAYEQPPMDRTGDDYDKCREGAVRPDTVVGCYEQPVGQSQAARSPRPKTPLSSERKKLREQLATRSKAPRGEEGTVAPNAPTPQAETDTAESPETDSSGAALPDVVALPAPSLSEDLQRVLRERPKPGTYLDMSEAQCRYWGGRVAWIGQHVMHCTIGEARYDPDKVAHPTAPPFLTTPEDRAEIERIKQEMETGVPAEGR
ncbi:MAG TPA: hypothetical protein VF274_02545 [Alphaproteobacteria bacterium]